MAVTTATAPGKVILFGEHAVVYGRPAIAAPVGGVRAMATVEANAGPGILLRAPDLARDYRLEEAPENDPFARAVEVLRTRAGLSRLPDLTLSVHSTIPIASGLGSGAAMAAAVIRALARHLGREDLATHQEVSAMTYEVEKLLHGTPSGIDNTVVVYEKPVYFVRRQPTNLIERLKPAAPLRLLIADTGMASVTKAVVDDVRNGWEREPLRFERLFDLCGEVARAARRAIELGAIEELGRLMSENQEYLRQMTVSSPELEKLVTVANDAGALGAKLSGAGRGGNMIALVDVSLEEPVRRALLAAGARTTMTSVVS
jgi:mevalonate kinase